MSFLGYGSTDQHQTNNGHPDREPDPKSGLLQGKTTPATTTTTTGARGGGHHAQTDRLRTNEKFSSSLQEQNPGSRSGQGQGQPQAQNDPGRQNNRRKYAQMLGAMGAMGTFASEEDGGKVHHHDSESKPKYNSESESGDGLREGGHGGSGGGHGSFNHGPNEHCTLPSMIQPLVTPLNHDVVENVVIKVRDGAEVTQRTISYVWDEWKQFVNRGNIIDLGIGVVIGSAFSDIIDSFVADILTPPLSLWAWGTNLENSFIVLRHGKTPDRQYATYQEAQADGAVTENTGHFMKACLNFLVIAFFLFWIVKVVHNIRKEGIRPPPKEKMCNWCKDSIALDAFRCKFCQSFVKDIPGVEDVGPGMFYRPETPDLPTHVSPASPVDGKTAGESIGGDVAHEDGGSNAYRL